MTSPLRSTGGKIARAIIGNQIGNQALKKGIMSVAGTKRIFTYPPMGDASAALQKIAPLSQTRIGPISSFYHTPNLDNAERRHTIIAKINNPLIDSDSHLGRPPISSTPLSQIFSTIYSVPYSPEKLESQSEIISKESEDETGISGTEIRNFKTEHLNTLRQEHSHPLTREEKRQLNSLLNTQRNSDSVAQEYMNGKFGKQPTEKEGAVQTSFFIAGDQSLDNIHENNRKALDQARNFNEHISKIMKGTNNKEKIEALQSFLDHGARSQNEGPPVQGMERFNSIELKTIFTKLWELNAHDQMIEMMESSENKHFTTNPLNLIFYARAILKGHYFNKYNAHAIADLLINNPKTHTEGLIIKGIIEAKSRVVAKELLNCLEDPSRIDLEEKRNDYLDLFPKANTDIATVREKYHESLDHALGYFQQAFSETYDCRFGCRAMHYLLEKDSLEEACDMAKLVKLAALKEGGLKSHNLAVVRAYLEALYVLPESNQEEISLAQNILFTLCKTENQIKNVIDGISTLKIDSNSDSHDSLRRSFVNHLASQYYQLERNPEEHTKEIERTKKEIKESENEWEQYTFDYKGLNSNHIEGNFKFGAQLPAHNINAHDREFFKEIATTPLNVLFNSESHPYGIHETLQDVKTFEEFNSLANALIRREFHTDEWDLEQLDSLGHKKYDESVQSLIALSGASTRDERKLVSDSRTNISANLLLGLGDCRHHSQVKQILFDIWHGHQLAEVLKEIDGAMLRGDQSRVEILEQEFNKINSEQLHTIDCEVYLPIEMKDGVPVIEDGHFVMNTTGIPVKVEEHTLNVEMNYNPISGKLNAVNLRDGFYQSTYPWANCPIDIEGQSLKSGTDAGVIEVYNPATGTLESRHPVIRPTNYAGKRAEYDRGNNDSRFIGHPVEVPSFTAANKQDMLNERNRYLDEARKWYQATS